MIERTGVAGRQVVGFIKENIKNRSGIMLWNEGIFSKGLAF